MKRNKEIKSNIHRVRKENRWGINFPPSLHASMDAPLAADIHRYNLNTPGDFSTTANT